MTKTKNTAGRVRKYLRELSVVVAGVAITLIASGLINHRNEQKDQRRYLAMVKMELEDNLAIVQQQYDYYDRTGKLAKYLYGCGSQENIQPDSLARYNDVMRDLKYMVYKTSAFEMLKSSGTMRLIKNKEFLQSIWDCYLALEYAKNMADKEVALKNHEIRSGYGKRGNGRIQVMETGI